MVRALVASLLTTSLLLVPSAQARGPRHDVAETLTAEEALDKAERQLEMGGNAVDIAARLHKSRGLTKDEKQRLAVIDARCDLLTGAFASSEKLLEPLHRSTPEDPRITEWYARSLDGTGKGERAMPLLKDLADKDSLKDGDSYWTLAQLEEKSGNGKLALEHAKAALTHPIVLQSDELDKEIHAFIGKLEKSKN